MGACPHTVGHRPLWGTLTLLSMSGASYSSLALLETPCLTITPQDVCLSCPNSRMHRDHRDLAPYPLPLLPLRVVYVKP